MPHRYAEQLELDMPQSAEDMRQWVGERRRIGRGAAANWAAPGERRIGVLIGVVNLIRM